MFYGDHMPPHFHAWYGEQRGDRHSGVGCDRGASTTACVGHGHRVGDATPGRIARPMGAGSEQAGIIQGATTGVGWERWCGGKPTLAQASGKDVSKVGDALQIVPGLVAEHLG
jgi:hypothetical protein